MQYLGPKLHPCTAAVAGQGPGLVLQAVPSGRVRLVLAPLLDQGFCGLCSAGRMGGSCQHLLPWNSLGMGKVAQVLLSPLVMTGKEAETALLSKPLRNAFRKVIYPFGVLGTF